MTPEGEAPDGEVRWPAIAVIGLVLAIVTVVGGLVAAVVAAFLL